MKVHFRDKFKIIYISSDNNNIRGLNDYEIILTAEVDLIIRYEDTF